MPSPCSSLLEIRYMRIKRNDNCDFFANVLNDSFNDVVKETCLQIVCSLLQKPCQDWLPVSAIWKKIRSRDCSIISKPCLRGAQSMHRRTPVKMLTGLSGNEGQLLS